MKTASLKEIKSELSSMDAEEISALLQKVVKYKKENKELLNFLLFYAEDPEEYIRDIKHETQPMWAPIDDLNTYKGMKSVRKVLRLLNRYIRYGADKRIEVELRIYFCRMAKELNRRLRNTTAFENLYEGQLKKIRAAMEKLHEDIRGDYSADLNSL